MGSSWARYVERRMAESNEPVAPFFDRPPHEIEATIRTDFEVTEVGAGFGQYLVGKPDCAVRQSAAADQAPRPRIWWAELN